MGDVESQLVNEVTELTARNLSEEEKKAKIDQLLTQETEIRNGLANPHSIIHKMVFTSEKEFFLEWANKLKQLHYLGHYTKPINTIQSHIYKQVGRMESLSADKKENIRTNLYKYLPEEFSDRQDSEDVYNTQKNTSAFLTPDDSVYLQILEKCIAYHRKMIEAYDVMFKHCQNKQIHDDMTGIIEWEEYALMCSTIIELNTPIRELIQHTQKLDEQLADHTAIQNIIEQCNIRQVLDTFRNCERILGILGTSHRNNAHKFGMVPRQFQRVRERDESWPEKAGDMVFKQVQGSYLCPHCKFDIVNNTQRIDYTSDEFFLTYRFKDKKYAIPEKYKGKGLNPFQIATLVFEKKIKLVQIP